MTAHLARAELTPTRDADLCAVDGGGVHPRALAGNPEEIECSVLFRATPQPRPGRWSLRSEANQRWQGILKTTHRTSRRYEQHPRVCTRSSFRAFCMRDGRLASGGGAAMNGTSHRHGKKTHSHPSSGSHRHVSALRLSRPVEGPPHHHHADDHGHGHPHGGHSHGLIDPSILRSQAGVKAVALSFGVLGITAVLEAVVFAFSGSVALLADLIHNGGDALTAIPLGVAFFLGSRRGERWAGYFVVFAIFVSASVAAYESIDRLIHPEHLHYLWAMAAAGVIGFVGNEIAARIRLAAGQRLDSAALLADGAHARVDGFVSLGVVASAVVVALGFPRADPLIGLAITVLILRITWAAWRTVRTEAR